MKTEDIVNLKKVLDLLCKPEILARLEAEAERDDIRKSCDKAFHKAVKELEEKAKALKKEQQDKCSHLAGGNPLSERSDLFGRTSIIWHTLNNKHEVGICQICGKEWRDTDSDYQEWKSKQSFSRPSSAVLPEGTKELETDESREMIPWVPRDVTFSDPKSYDEKWGW